MLWAPPNKQPLAALTLCCAVCILQLTGCSIISTNDQEVTLEDVHLQEKKPQVLAEETTEVDPYEGFNRVMYNFNTSLDTYFAGPIINGYKWVAPEILQTGVSNVFANMNEINVVLNDLLQGKMQQGAEDTGRFLLNSTVGIAGIFDVANYVGLEQHDEDFGQTFAVWGVPKGPYLVLPILGPATFRGVPGAALDTLANPVTYLGWPVAVMAAIDKRSSADESIKFIDEAAVDRYIFTRESYLQWRDYLASDGKLTANDDFMEDDFFMDDEDDLYVSDQTGYIVAEGGDALNLEKVENKTPTSAQHQSEAIIPAQNSDAQASTTQAENSAEKKAFDKASEAFSQAQQDYKKAAKELEDLRTKGSKFKPGQNH
jgi:phospholipid-binding lipoprotein MlaA